MKTILKIFGGLIGLVVIVVVGTLIGARFADGPMGLIAGGEFTSGTPAGLNAEPDWSFVKDYQTVEFQLLNPASSRKADFRPFQMSAASKADWLSFTVFTLCVFATSMIFASIASISASDPSTSTISKASTSIG